MKLPAKRISSPGRAEKYPPPLMRFLRTSVGNRSRSRSRSSPMFVRKKNTGMETTQEPSSPKVTCMGQVRVRRSKQDKTQRTKQKSRCRWIPSIFFCHREKAKLKLKCFRPAWFKWVLFFRPGLRRNPEISEGSSRIEPEFGPRSSGGVFQRSSEEDAEDDGEEEEEEELHRVYVPTAVTPPKNAFLLTRCRSAPYRSSSLACRFWGSPLSSEETESKQRTDLYESPTSKREFVYAESDQESQLDPESPEKIQFFREFEGSVTSIRERVMRSAKIEDLRPEGTGNLHPLMLTRCKSEPARIAKKLDPEMTFWKKGRLGFI
ncbi:hypothetical protein K2173_001867 [Erythroxylum novogranatense]|uniref:Uncharacterized protein n=1 Tax=Erythroxylum novogranatense TaxID=1862640 RepID=A0AAV8SPT2_9ROSI|nr:hypothetical protein K2173_001867 [Erythroxylum novogranatense]